MLPVQKKVIQVYQNGSPDKAVEEAIQIAISKYPAAGEHVRKTTKEKKKDENR